MFKGKILTHCGNEFTVFFLKDGSSGYNDPNHPLNKHDTDAKYSTSSYSLGDLNWMDVNENSAGEGHGFLNYTFTDNSESQKN